MYKQTYLILKPLDINLNWDLQMCLAELNILLQRTVQRERPLFEV